MDSAFDAKVVAVDSMYYKLDLIKLLGDWSVTYGNTTCW